MGPWRLHPAAMPPGAADGAAEYVAQREKEVVARQAMTAELRGYLAHCQTLDAAGLRREADALEESLARLSEQESALMHRWQVLALLSPPDATWYPFGGPPPCPAPPHPGE